MTAKIQNVKKNLAGIGAQAEKTSKQTDKVKESLGGIKGDYSASISLRDRASQGIQRAMAGLRGFSRGDYSAVIGVKDRATEQISRVKSELTGFAGKTYTAVMNVKSSLPQGGMGGGLKDAASGMMMGMSAQMMGAAGIGFGVYDAVKSYMDFEKEMSAVKALSGATNEEFAALTEKAKQMGADTKFSAMESAQAFEYMAQAGWKTSDMMNGIEGIMNLAAASGEDLAQTSDIVTDALTAFGLQAKDSAMFSDVLAAAATNSNTNVSKMGYTFKYVAPLAGAMGYSVQDVGLAIGLMANQGIKGEQAGTSLRGILTAMTAPTKDSAAAMEMLGVSLTDSTGKVRPFRDVLVDLRKGFATLDPVQKNNVANMLAGQEGMTGLLALVNASDADFDKLADSIDNSSGAAKRMADIRLDNLAGDLEYLSGDWDALVMKFTSGAAAGGLRSLVQEVDDIVQTFSTAVDDGFQFSDVLTTVGKVVQDLFDKFIQLDGVGSVLAGGALAGGLVKIIQLLNRAKNGINTLNDIINNMRGLGGESAGTNPHAAKTSTVPRRTAGKSVFSNLGDGAKWLGRNAKGLGGAALGVSALMGAYDIYNAQEGQRAEVTGSTLGGLGGGLAGAKVGAMAGGAIGSIVPGVGTAIGAGLGGLAGGIAGSIFGSDIGADLGKMLGNIDFGSILSGLTDGIAGAAAGIGESLYNGIIEPLGNIGIDLLNIIVGTGAVIGEAVAPLFQPLADAAGEAMAQLIPYFDAAAQWIQSTWSGVASWFSGVWDTIVAGANYVYGGITSFFSAAGTVVQSVWNSVSATFSGIYNSIAGGASYVYGAITSAFSSAAAAVKSVWSGVVSFFQGIWNSISSIVSNISGAVSSVRSIGAGITGLDHNATGTTSFAGGWTEINERGGEIVDLPSGSRIYPAQTTERIIRDEIGSSTGSAPANISISGNTFVVREEADIDRIAYQLMQLLSQANNNYGGVY